LVGSKRRLVLSIELWCAVFGLHSESFAAAALKVPSMSVDLVHPAAEKIALILEGIGDDKVRVNSSSLVMPFQPELAMGAVVDGGASIIVRNEDVIEHCAKAHWPGAWRGTVPNIVQNPSAKTV
jgi:hypothetical protein